MSLFRQCVILCYLFGGVAQALDNGFSQSAQDNESNGAGKLVIDEGLPDTTGLWYHLSQNDKRLANQEFARLTSFYPQWKPDSELLAAIAKLNAKQTNPSSVENAISNESELNIVTPPDAMTQGELALIEIAKTDEKQWSLIPNDKIELAAKAALKDSTGRYLEMLAWVFNGRKNYSASLRFFELLATHSPDSTSINDGKQAAISGLAKQWMAEQNLVELQTLIADYPAINLPKIIEAEAWQLFEQKKYAESVNWFAFVKNTEGQVYALDQLGKTKQAENIACANRSIATLLEFCLGSLSARQARLFEDNALEESVKVAMQLKQYRPLTEAETTLNAWANYKLNNWDLALPAFTTLLEKDPQNESYAQVVFELTADSPLEQQVLANRFTLLNQLLDYKKGEKAWYRKQFDLAYRYGYEPAMDVYGKQSFETRVGVDRRQRSGDVGLNKLDHDLAYVAIADVWQGWRWQLKMNYENNQTGEVVDSTRFGKGLNDDFYGVPEVNGSAVALTVGQQFDDFNIQMNMAYQLHKQPINPDLTGLVMAKWFFDNGQLSVTAFHQGKTESLLSTTGAYTAANQEPWGGVTQTGGRILGVYSYAKNWSVASTLAIESLSGDKVEDNNMYSFRFDLSHELKEQIQYPLDHLRIGPFLSRQSYDKNLSDFTLGHGGYFSPSRFDSMGLYADLLTEEGKEWQLHSSLNLGYSQIEQDAYWRFPLTNSGERIAASVNKGLFTNLEIEGQWRFHPHWSVAGYIKQIHSTDFDEMAMGIQLRWHIGNGTGLTSEQFILSQGVK